MSTIRVNNIVPPNVGEGVSIDGLQMPTAGALSNRNLVINGAMTVAQRATQVTGATTSSYYTCDRQAILISSLGTWTIDQSTDAPDGFSNSLKLTCTTANASPSSGAFIQCRQSIEAQNLQLLGFGTAGAKAITLSFWVKSNKTGNANFTAFQADNASRLVSFQYTISSASTWEYKTITIPGDTAGVINNDNGAGLTLEFWLNSGSTYTGGSNQNDWSTLVNTNRNASNLGLGGSTSDYWQITGVQLEVGSKATPFEHESYGQTLQKCLRYYERMGGTKYAHIGVGKQRTTSQTYFSTTFKVVKRAAPTVTFTNNIVTSDRYNHDQVVIALEDVNINTDGLHARFTHTAVGAEHRAAFIQSGPNSPFGFIELNSEL